jgi:hypothetical protein
LILAQYVNVDEDIVMQSRLPEWDVEGRLLSDMAERQLVWMQKYGMIDEIPSVDDLYDYSFTGKTTISEIYGD